MSQPQLSALIPLILLFVLMYFLFWRPQMSQVRRRREMLAALRTGDRVVTVGGLHATIIDIKDEVLTLELAPNVRVKGERSAVQAMRGRSGGEREKPKAE